MNAPAMLLAAGLGTRLRPLTLHRPKPLVPVCGAPMLDHALALLRRHGVESAVVNAFHLPEQIERWAATQELPLRVVVEAPRILGTGGGLRNVQALLAESVVVLNGDTLCDVDLEALRAGLVEGVDAVMALRRLQPGEPYLQVTADTAGRVVDLIGLAVAAPEGEARPGTHFTGVHALRRSVLERLPDGESCIVRQGYVHLVPGRRLGARLHTGTWFDVGTPQSYLDANLLALAGRLALPLDPLAGAAWACDGVRTVGGAAAVPGAEHARLIPPFRLDPGVELGPDATVGPNVILGADSRVGAGASVRDAVIWERQSIPAGTRLGGAVVFDGGTLPLSATDLSTAGQGG